MYPMEIHMDVAEVHEQNPLFGQAPIDSATVDK